MASKRDTKVLNINIDAVLLERVDRYRFKQMFASRTEAIMFLLETGLKANPRRALAQKPKPEGE